VLYFCFWVPSETRLNYQSQTDTDIFSVALWARKITFLTQISLITRIKLFVALRRIDTSRGTFVLGVRSPMILMGLYINVAGLNMPFKETIMLYLNLKSHYTEPIQRLSILEYAHCRYRR